MGFCRYYVDTCAPNFLTNVSTKDQILCSKPKSVTIFQIIRTETEKITAIAKSKHYWLIVSDKVPLVKPHHMTTTESQMMN